MSTFDIEITKHAAEGEQITSLMLTGESSGFFGKLVDLFFDDAKAIVGAAKGARSGHYLVGSGDEWRVVTIARDLTATSTPASDAVRSSTNSKTLVVDGKVYRVIRRLR